MRQRAALMLLLGRLLVRGCISNSAPPTVSAAAVIAQMDTARSTIRTMHADVTLDSMVQFRGTRLVVTGEEAV